MFVQMIPFPQVAGGSLATIEFVGSGVMTAANATYNFSSLLNESGSAPTLQEGDLVLILHNNTATGTPLERTPPTGYTKAFDRVLASDSVALNLNGYYKVMGATPDSSVFIPDPPGTTWDVLTIHVLRNVDPTTPLDVTPTTASGIDSGIADPASITPVTEGALIVACGASALGSSTPGVHTNPSGFSSVTNHFRQTGLNATADPAIGTGLLFDWTSGAVDPGTMGGKVSTAASWCAVTLALRPNTI